MSTKLPYGPQWSLLLAAGERPARAERLFVLSPGIFGPGCCHSPASRGPGELWVGCSPAQQLAGASPLLPLANVGSIVVPPATGSIASYMVTRAETQKCSDFWIYLETDKSPQELAMAGRVSQPTGMFTSPPAAFPGLVMPGSSLLQQFAGPAS